MTIKKLGQSCLVIETKGKKIMTDPGSFSVDLHVKEKNIDLILITHEHGDHLHIESLKEVVKNNPNAKIITNNAIGKILSEAGLQYEVLEHKTPKEFSGVEIEAHDCKHEELFEAFGQAENTAFFIDKRLFHPGDSFYNPGKPIEILALPVAGPWSRVRDFMRYAVEIKPKVCFPFHDAMLTTFVGSAYFVPEAVLPKFNIEFKVLEIGTAQEF